MVQTYSSNNNEYLYDHFFSLSVTSLIFFVARNENGWVGGKITNLCEKADLELFLRFRKCVELNYRKEHNVAWYVSNLSTSEYLLNKCVLMCAQKKALDFIIDRVVMEAQRMIIHSSLMIKEIAFKLGFKDTSYFIRYFKRRVGMSPSQYKDYMSSSH